MKKQLKLINIIILFMLLSVFSFGENFHFDFSKEEKEYIKSNPQVSVGIVNLKPFTYYENGEYKGFSINLLRELASRAGLGIDFKLFENFDKMLIGAESDEIQILSQLAYSKNREEFFTYGKQSIAFDFKIFHNDKSYDIEKFADLQKKKIAVVERFVTNQIVINKFPHANLIVYKTLEEAFNAVSRGDADATIMARAPGRNIIEKLKLDNLIMIHPDDCPELQNNYSHSYIAVKKNKTLVSIFDKVFDSMGVNEVVNLYAKWAIDIPDKSKKENELLVFTEAEREYLNSKKYLSVMNLNNFQPFSFINNNKPDGYSIEIMKEIGKILKKELVFIQKPWNEQLEMLKKGDLDIIPHAAVTEERKTFIDYTDFVHLTFLIGFVVQKNTEIREMADLKGKKLAVINGYYLHDYLKANFKEIELLPVKSGSELIEAVAQGKADAGIDNLPTLSYFIQQKWTNNLETVSVTGLGMALETEMPMAVKKGNSELKSILEKANAALERNRVQEIKQKWLSDTGDNRIILLTEEERNYLKNKKELLMCIDPDWLPFEAIENGEHIGMTADYFELFEKMIGIPIKLVETKNWLESLEIGKAKGCDIFSLVMPTPEREEYLQFTDSYFETPLVLVTDMNSKWINDLSEIDDKKIGISQGYAYGEILKTKYPDKDFINVKNIHDGLTKVENGELYAYIGTLATVGYHLQTEHIGMAKISGRFKELWKLGIGTRIDEPILNQIFNKVVASLREEDHRKIINKWINIEINDFNENELSYEEQKFIEKNNKLRVRIRNNRPPFEFSENGKPAGLAVDYLTAISEKIDLEFEFISDDTLLPEAFEIMETRRDKFDILPFLVKNEERAKRFAFGDSYLSYPMMIITHKNLPYIGKVSDLIGKKVVIEKGFLTREWLERDYIGINIIDAEGTKEALEMVNSEKVDAYVGNLAVANYMMIHEGMENLKVQAPSNYGNVDYHFVAPKEWPELVSILNKGHNMLTANEHSLIQQKWFSMQIIERFNYKALIQVIAIAILFMIFMIYWNRRLAIEKSKTQRALEKVKEISIRDKLTSLYNRTRLDEVLVKELERAQRFEQTFGIILIDIDFFKKINDNYGHNVGDKVLIQLSNLLQQNFRDVDTIGRWGGEEFLIICPETDGNGIILASEKMRKIIAEFSFEDAGTVTASFGCANFEGDLTTDKIIIRADEALYNSKKTGRNKVSYNKREV